MNPVELLPLLSQTRGQTLVPPVNNRAAWQELGQTPVGAYYRQQSLERAEILAQRPILMPTRTAALAFAKTGDRAAWEGRKKPLLMRASVMTLAACFSGEERWLEEAEDALWAVCEVANWVMPAHRGYETDTSPGFDLGAAGRGLEVGEALTLLAPELEKLDPRFAAFAQHSLEEKVFTPYLRDDYWFLRTTESRPVLNNWNAVCSGGALLAALAALDDEPKKQAAMVVRALESLSHFLDTFGDAGSLDEGVGYWIYGFSYYVMAAERVWSRTNGAIDLLADPKWREVAQFPLRANLHGDFYINFSDCAPRHLPNPGWLVWLARHLDLPNVAAWASQLAYKRIQSVESIFNFPLVLRDLAWQSEEIAPARIARPLSIFLPDVEWFVVRSRPDDDALVAVVKGGHNAESHNHNDGGSLIVHLNGEALIDEMGAPTYTRQFFGPERYQNIAARSLGHSVPFPNETEQSEGREFRARVLERSSDEIALELSGFYPPEAGLKSLVRTSRFNRADNSLLLRDKAEFLQYGASFQSQLMIPNHSIEILAPGKARIRGQKGILELEWPASQAEARVETVETDDSKFVDENGESRWKKLMFEVKMEGRNAALELTMRAHKAGTNV